MIRGAAAGAAVLAAFGCAAACSGSRAGSAGCARPPLPRPPAGRPKYVLTVRLAPDLQSASGTLRVMFAPEVATDRIVLRLWPDGPAYDRIGARLTVGRVTLGGRAVSTSRPDPTMLVIRRRLAARHRISLATTWRLVLPLAPGQRLRGGSYVRLGSFFPLLAWTGDGWATDPPIHGILETWTSPTADFDVRIDTPPGLRVLATGAEVSAGHWRAQAVRDFAVAVGRFSVARRVVRVPNRVTVEVGVAAGVRPSPRAFLDLAARVLRAHSSRYGAYPWRTLTFAAMPDALGRFAGIEYPNLVFLLGHDSRVVVSHETGHQWFYSLVGNDQARDPWLDESLATWAQTRFDGSLSQFLKIPMPPAVRDRLGEPTAFWDAFTFRTTLAGVYVQGVQALASLGPAPRVDCALRAYVAANAYRTATPRDLLSALEPFFPDARSKLERRGARF